MVLWSVSRSDIGTTAALQFHGVLRVVSHATHHPSHHVTEGTKYQQVRIIPTE